MAVGLKEPREILPVAGVQLASITAGIKKNGKDDLVLITIEPSANCAATFTQNAFCAAPVTVAKSHLAADMPRALLINSGNANAGTGDVGIQNAIQSCQWLAEVLDCLPQQVLPFSTGVIGQQLPMQVFQSGITKISEQLSIDNWMSAARGIMTTDTVAKAVSRTFMLNDREITISAIAKGSGMICPNMATMLAFIATDANVEADFLQQCLSSAVEGSFNAITVDGDTSTNDACVLIATGKTGNAPLTAAVDAEDFIDALHGVCMQLAQAIVRDAEGATKFVTIKVVQAQTKAEAKDVAYTIAHSPLVKTALFASDPNWGRILAAVGRAGIERLDVSRVNIFLGDVCIVRQGAADESYTEEQGQAVMDKDEITITVELNRASESATVWTSDLSHEYVRINAEYRS
ncbi:MAG: bifunctional glutamate N-acetyltransferase/amino-acid acetyltransferase ArgJ [Gammaproteobacteria bacterium]|nr:bifunctional glutamate N-acetyltransferase/amino-acid acetyltransferase ArgJ [Gammaproteobacteria bacterium]